MNFDYHSNIFTKEKVQLANTEEYLIRGGRSQFSKLASALEGIKEIGVIGWGSQAPAQSCNLRDSLQGTGIRVSIGLREGSSSKKHAEAEGFTEANGTLGEMFEVIKRSDLVLLLISDYAQSILYKKVFASLKKGATLGLSHGFLLGHLRSINEYFPSDINVIGVCPKGMGPSVRRLYEQGKKVDGAGINASFAVEQDYTGKATDYAIAWSIALGSPFSFCTSLEMEFRSDIYGERGILLGAVHGIVECLYRYFVDSGMSKEQAFINSVENITGPISKTISHKGIYHVYDAMNDEDKSLFKTAYSLAYLPAKEILQEIYDEVASCNEIRSVVMTTRRTAQYPVQDIDTTEMWRIIGTRVRAQRDTRSIDIHPLTAGIYIASMMAQIDILLEQGHSYSEVINESVIEAVDSLNPYMHYKGVSYMVDNCSTTAKLGSRKWAPRFDYHFTQNTLAKLKGSSESPTTLSDTASNTIPSDASSIQAFVEHSVHSAITELLKFRPSVDIAVT